MRSLGRFPSAVRLVASSAAVGADDRAAFERIAVPIIVAAYAVGIPLFSFGRVLAAPHGVGAAAAALLGTGFSVPLQLWLLVPAAHGRRPRRTPWIIAAFAVINAAVFPVIGVRWFAAGEQLAVLLAVFLPLRWSVPAVAALAAAPAATAAAGHDVALGRYFAQTTVVWPLLIGALIWLARTLATLRASREELAGAAVIDERLRIDDELRISVGAELEQLVAAGRRAAQAADDHPAAAVRELRLLTDASRGALVKTRRLVSRYQLITVRSELATAMALLAAAGIRSTTDVGPDVLDEPLDDAQTAGFRSALTAVLREGRAPACIISAGGRDGRTELTIVPLGPAP